MNAPPERLILRVEVLKKGLGEDSSPIIHKNDSDVLLGVFDGLGGSGARKLIGPNGDSVTEARVAAQAVSQSVGNFFRSRNKVRHPKLKLEQTRFQLHDDLEIKLQETALELGLTTSQFRGSLVRLLPTTMAIAYCRRRAASWTECSIYWAGDSRCFLFTPASGLQQLTRDDLKIDIDAYQNIYDEMPMSNVINVSQSFFIRALRLRIADPAMIICATDGCFSCFKSPQEFELVLLRTLLTASDQEKWRTSLARQFQKNSSDDATLALSTYGWGSFEQVRNAFRDRQTVLTSQHRTNKRSMMKSGIDDPNLVRRSWWDAYKPGYEALMARRPDNKG